MEIIDAISGAEQRKRALFDAASDLPDDQQADYVLDATRDTPILGEAVLKLLRNHRASTAGVLDRPLHQRLETAEPRHPDVIGRFEVIRHLGTGGMGSVYACRDTKSEEIVAVKMIRSNIESAAARKHFERESQILRGLHHPNVCRMLDAGITETGTPFIVMQFIEGKSLDIFCHHGSPPLESRLLLMSQVLAGVEYFHRRNVIHRDLKPSNILVTAAGSTRILDFGTAKIVQHRQGFTGHAPTVTSHPFLTIRYASPERLSGRLSGRSSDVYSLGVICYELLTGRHPFEDVVRRGMLALADAQLTGVLPARPSGIAKHLNIPESSDNLVLNALIADPGIRYGSVGMFLDDLRKCLEGASIQPRFSPEMIRSQGYE